MIIMKKKDSIFTALPVLFGFFVMGFCDIVGISSDYVQRTFHGIYLVLIP